jgi:light-independent protochlorophyllide reductase subunit B
MERHMAKRLGIPCAVISAPVHVQDFPARYAPQMGFEGANVLFDTWVHPLMMGLEEHLLGMFREDFEFHDDAGSSHLSHPTRPVSPRAESAQTNTDMATAIPAAIESNLSNPPATEPVNDAVWAAHWSPDAEKELHKIPFFVRGKARRNTEQFARDRALSTITIETLYDAKAHFGR